MSIRSFDVDVHINNSPEMVMSYIADVNNRPFFIPSLKSVEIINGDPSAEGTTWKWKWLSVGLEFEGTAKCTRKEAGKLYAFETEGGVKSSWEYTAMPKDGGTDVRLHVTYEMPAGVPARLMTDEVLAQLRRAEAEVASQNLKLILDQ